MFLFVMSVVHPYSHLTMLAETPQNVSIDPAKSVALYANLKQQSCDLSILPSSQMDLLVYHTLIDLLGSKSNQSVLIYDALAFT